MSAAVLSESAVWSWPALLASASLAVLWGHAALHKAWDREAWRTSLQAYGAGRLTRGAALVLPAAEASLALGLLSDARVAAAWGSAALLLLYALAMARQLWLGRETDCGCGGLSLPVSWALVARNLVLLAWSAVAAQPARLEPGSLQDFVWLVLALPVCVLLYTALHQVLRHLAWMRTQDLKQRGM